MSEWQVHITNECTYVLKEDLQDTTRFLVDETGDTLDTTTAGKTTNSGLGDTCTGQISVQVENPKTSLLTLNVVTKNLTVTLGTALSETLEDER